MAPRQSPAKRPRVALCLAGAWRNDSGISWQTIRQQIVEPTGAAVFVAHTNDEGFYHGKDRHEARVSYAGKNPSTSHSAESLRAIIGPALRGTAVWDHHALLTAPVHSWAGSLAAAAMGVRGKPPAYMMNWVWYLKRWACQALVQADPQGPYDIVITSRPDIVVTARWNFSFATNPNSLGDDSRKSAVNSRHFALHIYGERPVYFGEREIVMHNELNKESCTNDWVAVSTVAASTTLNQLIHHAATALAFTHQNKTACRGYDRPSRWPWSVVCCESLLAAYLWRVGLARQVTDMHVWKYGDHPRELMMPNGSLSKHAHQSGTKDGRPRVRGLWAIPEYARFGAIPAKVKLYVKLYEDVPTKCEMNAPAIPYANISAERPAGNASAGVCWTRKQEKNEGTKSWMNTCGAAVLPGCGLQVNLLQPLRPCIRKSNHLDDFVRTAIGYGQPFPWWKWCNGPCKPLPNAKFDFRGKGMEAAIMFPFNGSVAVLLAS